MVVVAGLILLIAAVVVGVAGVLSNAGSGHNLFRPCHHARFDGSMAPSTFIR